MSSVVPSGGSLDDDRTFRQTKVVDRSNAFSKLSKRGPASAARVESTIFAPQDTAVVQPIALRSRSPNYTDPFGDNREMTKQGGVKMVPAPAAQPRYFSKKIVPSTIKPQTADDKSFTFHGTPYGGRATFASRNTPSDNEAFERSQQRSMERFRKSKIPTTNVLLPETLVDSVPYQKPQRFHSSSKYTHPTLEGVLHPVPGPAPAPYRVVPPWHTSA